MRGYKARDKELVLVATILELKSKNQELLVELWKAKNVSEVDISLQEGRKEAFTESARIVRSLID